MSRHLTIDDMNVTNGVAGLNTSNRITKGMDATDDLISDTNAKGLVLKDVANNYWRIGINTLGVLTITNLGTTKP